MGVEVTEMLFSIIMPVYGVERYLAKSIQSVLNQTFKEFELILIEDASPDKCGEICQTFSEKDTRIRLVHNQCNQGVCAARNTGIHLAKGDWIWFVDPDDTIAPNALEVLRRHLSPDLDVLFFGFQYVIETGDSKEQKAKISMPAPMAGTSEKAIASFVLQNDLQHTFAPVWNKLYRRGLIQQRHITFPDTTLEDAFFNFNVFSYANHIKTIPACFYFYLRRKSGSLSKKRAWNRLDSYNKRYQTVLHFLRQKNACTKGNLAKAFYCYVTRLFYVLYVAMIPKK